MTTPEQRMLKLELQHAIAAIERARLLADDELKADLARLLEEARATLDLARCDEVAIGAASDPNLHLPAR